MGFQINLMGFIGCKLNFEFLNGFQYKHLELI